jgi:hypothetical protein
MSIVGCVCLASCVSLDVSTDRLDPRVPFKRSRDLDLVATGKRR